MAEKGKYDTSGLVEAQTPLTGGSMNPELEK
jgi:hypothetical protein